MKNHGQGGGTPVEEQIPFYTVINIDGLNMTKLSSELPDG